MSNPNASGPSNQNQQSMEMATGNIGNLLTYGSINLTLTLELFDNDFIENNIEWKKITYLSNVAFLKENTTLWDRIKLSSTDPNMQLLLHMNKVLKEKIKIKVICLRKMKYKQNQIEFKEFLNNIININGLYFESHSVCRCELSIQLRLRYNGKRRLLVLCGDKSPLEDDCDEDEIDNSYKENDNVLLAEGANEEDYQNAEAEDENEVEVFEIEEKKDNEEYNPFIELPKEINNFNEHYFVYFNYFDYSSGTFSGSITIQHLYKYFIFLKKNSKVRIILNMMMEISDNTEEIRNLFSVSSITIFYNKNNLFRLLNKLRNEEEKIKKEQEHFRHYYEKKLKEEEIQNFYSNLEKKEKIMEELKNNPDPHKLNDEEKSVFSFNKSCNKTFYSMKTSKSKSKKNKEKEKEEEKMIVIKNNKYFPPLSKVDTFYYYKTGIIDKDPLKSKEDKVILVLDDFNKIYFVQFNYFLEKPFILDFDLKLYPKINVHNIDAVQEYKMFIRQNFERYIIIFIGYLLSSLAKRGIGGAGAEETSIFIGYLGACKILRNMIMFEKNDMPLPKDDNFFYPNLNKNEVEGLIEHAAKKKKEYKFVLDCNNLNTIKLKLYNPLLDKYVCSYLKKNTNKDFLKTKGFINNKGKLLYDPVYRESLNINKNEKIIENEKKLYQTCHDFKTKNNFKMKEIECLDRYKNKNDKLNKFVIGFKQKRPEYEIYLSNIRSNKLPLIMQKYKNFNNATSPRNIKALSSSQAINKKKLKLNKF